MKPVAFFSVPSPARPLGPFECYVTGGLEVQPSKMDRPSKTYHTHRDQEAGLPTPPPAPRDHEDFSRKLYDTAKSELFYDLPSAADEHAGGYALNLATLQRIRLHVIQYQIGRQVKDMRRRQRCSASSNRMLDTLLHDYCKSDHSIPYQHSLDASHPGDAIRDLDFMRQRGGPDKTKDPFIISSTSRDLDRTLLYEVGLIATTEDVPRARDYGERERRLCQPSRTEQDRSEQFQRFVERIAGAILGIVALFAPVLVMVFVPSLAVGLSATFGFMLLVAAGIAWFTTFSPTEVLSLSFAYAAVLVVFIGTSITP